ncbi:hypothetical protein EV186_105334 [Labedaea rhizosphaerae]|uniref:Uncharacterized protein n=1 Tax=Labedaea rhizosphaerae TaxID=598644 RepID=A0A4R6S5R1_LABRH|nr:hypothetical protein EV186_105334 [Labedaea rhizosphaerae]
MIIDGDGRDERAVSFVLASADRKHELLVRTDVAFADAFREHLTSQGFRLPDGDARSVVSEIITATAGNPAAWTAVGGVVVAFLRRHRGKVHRMEVEGKSVSIEGYSADEAEALAAQFLASSRRRQVGDGTSGPVIGARADLN